MIIAFAFLFTVLLVPFFGGEFWKLGAIKLERRELILGSLLIQVLIISVVHGRLSESIASSLHLISYALAIGFVWYNRNVVGMPIIVLGGLLNVLVIAANDGVMPARIGALQTAGIPYDTGDFENSAPVEDAKLWFLGDVFAIPEGFPFSNVFSIGDVLLILGGAITVHVVCGSKIVPERWRAKVQLTDAARQSIEDQADEEDSEEPSTATTADAATQSEAAARPIPTEPVPVPASLVAPTEEVEPEAEATTDVELEMPTQVADVELTPDVASPASEGDGPARQAPSLESMFAQDIPPLVYRREDLDVDLSSI